MNRDRELESSHATCTIRPQVSVRSVLALLVGLAALVSVQSWYSVAALSVISLTWLYGCPRTRAATKQVAAALYLPSLWMWLVASKLSGFWSNIGIWPALINLPAPDQPSSWMWHPLTACFFAVGMFLAAVTVIRFHPATRAWIFMLLAALSNIKALWIVYQWFSAS